MVNLLTICRVALAQAPGVKVDRSIPILKMTFDDKGDFVLKSSPTSSASDFDFLVSKWKMHNRHLKKRLENCQEWTEFNSTDENSKIFTGNVDMNTYSVRASLKTKLADIKRVA